MAKMTKNKIIELLRTGNFTVAYHDRDICDIYEGHHKYEDLPDNPVIECEVSDAGYIPNVVELLVKALNGKVEGA